MKRFAFALLFAAVFSSPLAHAQDSDVDQAVQWCGNLTKMYQSSLEMQPSIEQLDSQIESLKQDSQLKKELVAQRDARKKELAGIKADMDNWCQ
jgi:hypothetical protein